MLPNRTKWRLLAYGLPVLALGLVGCTPSAEVDLGYALAQDAPALTDADIQKILNQAQAGAAKETSLLRVNKAGKMISTRMHIIVVNRTGRIVGRRSMPDAWAGSVSIAKAKAFTAMAFSSDQNAPVQNV